jgi:hypothetical protein
MVAVLSNELERSNPGPLPLYVGSENGEHSIPGAFKEHTRSGNLR